MAKDMSSDATAFIARLENEPTFPDSIHALTYGIAEEIEARHASMPALKELAEKLRADTERIVDAIITGLVTPDAQHFTTVTAPPINTPLKAGVQIVAVAEGFEEAVEFVKSRGLAQLAAERIVTREGVTVILASKAEQEAGQHDAEDSVLHDVQGASAARQRNAA